MMKIKVCMPDIDDLRKAIMGKAHCLAYAMNINSTKMCRTIKKIICGLV